MTDTLDYVYVIDGPVELMLDDDSVVLQAGDCVVQRRTKHAWHNHNEHPIRMLGVHGALARRPANDSPELQLGPRWRFVILAGQCSRGGHALRCGRRRDPCAQRNRRRRRRHRRGARRSVNRCVRSHFRSGVSPHGRRRPQNRLAALNAPLARSSEHPARRSGRRACNGVRARHTIAGGSRGPRCAGFYCHPDAWGTGIATQLMTQCLAALGGHAGEVFLWTPRDAQRARHFYEKVGFRATGQARAERLTDWVTKVASSSVPRSNMPWCWNSEEGIARSSAAAISAARCAPDWGNLYPTRRSRRRKPSAERTSGARGAVLGVR